ncbi:hypothetical protein [Azospirillum rugosum]|uniref:Uncharacterized protein n=1 Tax=Azospirillum rugosum TaxID=416170 RepID=A0ABS4SFR4_9PROT|nr:hypothetical protein [Azospirillum rugosum]MBP2291414.1 hypothetical protein [Azospirillum rugosum]MDQ0525202.1 hypothetical protein [Azospirillum rugosum]
MAQQHLTWSFTTPLRMALEGADRSITLQYKAAGVRSGWAVVVDGRPAATYPDLCTAQDQALRLARQSPLQEAA